MNVIKNSIITLILLFLTGNSLFADTISTQDGSILNGKMRKNNISCNNFC